MGRCVQIAKKSVAISLPACLIARFSGCEAQGTDINGAPCTGEVFREDYQHCGRIDADLNVYWSRVNDSMRFLFETFDTGYVSIGFTEPSPLPMNGANVVVGCQNWKYFGFPLPNAIEINLPAEGTPRIPDNIFDGIKTPGRLQTMNLTHSRVSGVCGVQFERLAILPDNASDGTVDVNDAHDIIEGTQNMVVWAMGPADTIEIHDREGFVWQDFMLGEGEISNNSLVPLMSLVPASTPTPTQAPTASPTPIFPIPDTSSTDLDVTTGVGPTPSPDEGQSIGINATASVPTPTATDVVLTSNTSRNQLSSVVIGVFLLAAAAIF